MKSLGRRFGPSRSALLSIVAVGAVYAVTLSLLPEKGLWVVDNAAKLLQVKSILASNYSDYSIPWPGQAIDPDFKYKPIPDPFAYIDHDKMYSFYPPFFPAVSSVFFRAFGFRGLVILPLAASLIMLAGLAAMAGRLGAGITGEHTAVLAVGLGTPIWFYSVVFWEHTAAVCLTVWALWFVLRFVDGGSRRDLVLGSVLAALAVYFRDELYLFCGVLVVCAGLWRKPRNIGTMVLATASMAVTLVPLWLFQWRAIGHPFGNHIGSTLASEAGIIAHLRTRPSALYNLFVASTPRLWLSFAASGPMLVLMVLSPRLSRETYDRAVPILSAAGLGCFAAAFAGYFTSASPIDYLTEASNSFLTVAPFLILAFLRLRPPAEGAAETADRVALASRRVWAIGIGYAAIYALFAPEIATAGMHWGNRFLLGVYPLFGLLASVNLVAWWRGKRWRTDWRWVVVALVLLSSLASQVYSLTLLARKMEFSQRLNEAIGKRSEEIIITNVQWAPLDMYLEFLDRKIFLVPSKADFDGLVEQVGQAGYDKALLAVQLPEAQAAGAAFTVDDEGLNFFTLRFFEIEIGNR